MPKDNPYISLRLKPSVRKQLEERAALNERNLSQEIRLAIRHYLNGGKA